MKELLTTNVKAKYFGDTRYEKVWEQMQLLGIEDVTSKRQAKNGTRVWKLPIKNNWNNGKPIEVASFKTGYVRNQNSGYSNYQLNKRCESEPEYYQLANGNYRKYTTRTCRLIPNEIDRLEYLIGYCLKNYYIKNANQVAEGSYVSKWYHEFELRRANSTYGDNTGAMARINDMEEKLDAMTEDRDYKVQVLENKLATIQRIADHE